MDKHITMDIEKFLDILDEYIDIIARWQAADENAK